MPKTPSLIRVGATFTLVGLIAGSTAVTVMKTPSGDINESFSQAVGQAYMAATNQMELDVTSGIGPAGNETAQYALAIPKSAGVTNVMIFMMSSNGVTAITSIGEKLGKNAGFIQNRYTGWQLKEMQRPVAPSVLDTLDIPPNGKFDLRIEQP